MVSVDPMPFYAFMREREQVRLNKEAGLPRPWTEDAILNEYKFTNVKRAHDRTTRELRQHFYPASAEGSTLLMNCALARYFGTSEFAIAVGYRDTWNQRVLDNIQAVATQRMANKERVFTGAYVITNQGIKAPKQEVVTQIFLKNLLEDVDYLVRKGIYEDNHWQSLIESMMQIQGFGGTGFMAKEIVLDYILISGWQPADWRSWTPIGPGARRGIARVCGHTDVDTTEARKLGNSRRALETIHMLYDARNELWPDGWVSLELTDIQFQLCEFDKYERVRLGQGKPRSKYK